jgi:hypothetical protein
MVGAVALAAVCAAVPSIVFGAQAGHRPILVDHGRLGQYRWAVGVMRDGGTLGGQRPCVATQVLDTVYGGPNDFSQQKTLKLCSRLSVKGAPTIVSVGAGKEGAAVEVFGIAAVPAIRSLHLDFGPAGIERVKLRRLNGVQMRNAGVRSLRYAAFALPSLNCLVQVMGYSGSGAEIYRGAVEDCSGSGA